MTPNAPAIETRHLTVSYGPKPVLLDVTLAIEQGLLVGVIGPNGAGKSTLIKAVLGFVKPDMGWVRILGRPVSESRGLVAYVPQRGAVDWDFPITVEQVVLMGRFGHVPWWRDPGREDQRRVGEALEMVRMAEFRYRQIGQLSGGQQQRVFMARALAQGADVLVLDEPMVGVDAATERALWEVLTEARNAGRTLVVVHHDLASAAHTFDRLVLVNRRLYAYGPPAMVLDPDRLAEVYQDRPRVPTPIEPGGRP
jgi:manganese/iron transport system ATP-binding protein/manganese/zinc/iron transport system ATP- binding protein